MRLTDPDGQEWLVTRRWWPWGAGQNPRPQEQAPALLPAEVLDLVLRVVFLPVVIVLRAARVRRWPIQAWRGGELVHAEAVRGWTRSAERMTEMAEGIRRGVGPRPARRSDDDGATT